MIKTSVMDQVEALYATLHQDTDAVLRRMRDLYAHDVVFQDPIQTTHGIDAFIEANERFAHAMREISFVMHDRMEDDDRGFATWTFRVRAKRGPRMTIHGASHLRMREGRVVWHRDYWDLWGSFADSVPGVATVYRKLIGTLA